MYSVIELMNRKYLCSVQIQDGVERWEEDSFDGAIESVIAGTKFWNGINITSKEITCGRESDRVVYDNRYNAFIG